MQDLGSVESHLIAAVESAQDEDGRFPVGMESMEGSAVALGTVALNKLCRLLCQEVHLSRTALIPKSINSERFATICLLIWYKCAVRHYRATLQGMPGSRLDVVQK